MTAGLILPQPVLAARPDWFRVYEQAVQAQTDLQKFDLLRDLPPAQTWEDPVTFDEMRRSAVAQMERLARGHTSPPLPTASTIAALLIAQIIGIRPDAEENRILWHLMEDPPLGVVGLPWADDQIDLLVQPDPGGGQIVQIETPVPFTLELFTPHTTFCEVIPSGTTHIRLTVLDRTDVRG